MTRRGRRMNTGIGPFPLGPNSGRIVLLGMLAAEGTRRCKAEREATSKRLEERISFEEDRFPDTAERWHVRRTEWRPVACEIEFPPVSTTGLVAAPFVSLIARRDDGTERMVRYSICQRGLIRIALTAWPEEAPKPLLPNDPTNIAEAISMAQMAVARAMPPLLAFVDPLRA